MSYKVINRLGLFVSILFLLLSVFLRKWDSALWSMATMIWCLLFFNAR